MLAHTACGDALWQMNSHMNGREERVVWRVRVMLSGGAESNGESCSTVKDALAGVSSMLVERLLRRTGRGASTFGFRD